MKIIGNSDIGRVRKENQDAFWFCKSDDDIGYAVVCDGMGGARGGQQASTLCIEEIKKYIESKKKIPHIEEAIKTMVKLSNDLVFNSSMGNEELYGMGTTLVFAAILGNKAYIANVGDSRAYHITNGSISQITKDHSAVQELVDSGHITERQAKIHPNKNIITRAIGIEPEIEFDLFTQELQKGDVIVLCSDGMSNNVDENEIQFEASGGDFENLAQRLIDLANSRGGTDNITVVAIQL